MSDPDESEPFESIYARARDDLTTLPWTRLVPSAPLLAWLDGVQVDGLSVLVVGCGVGDDAEELARRGADVAAFDFAPTAIALCHKRFPSSTVDYRVADLFALPASWSQRFDLVVEVHTVQSVPPERQADAMGAIAATVAPGGRLFVRCSVRDDDEPLDGRPWFLRLRDLDAYVSAGLRVHRRARGRRDGLRLPAPCGGGLLARGGNALAVKDELPTHREVSRESGRAVLRVLAVRCCWWCWVRARW
jgi:SAM-dependent methyltransferase